MRASLIPSSEGHVSSPRITVLEDSDQIITSGRRFVVVISGGKMTMVLSKSISSRQSLLPDKSDFSLFGAGFDGAGSPSEMKLCLRGGIDNDNCSCASLIALYLSISRCKCGCSVLSTES